MTGILISLEAEKIFSLGSFPVTNSLLYTALVSILIVGTALIFRRKIVMVPGYFQSGIEMILEYFLELMDSVLGRRALSEKYLPLVGTIFLFVMTANWFSLLPGVGSLGLNEEGHGLVPLLRAPAADLNFTLALAIVTVVLVNVYAIRSIGLGGRLKHFFNFSNPVNFGIGLLELVSEFAKIISFSFRLFGNVFAGEVLLLIVAFLVPFVIPVPFLMLEVFVGMIQAFVFAMLALVFIAIATAHDESHDEKVGEKVLSH